MQAVQLMTPVRDRSLPEHLAYRDTGCAVHPACLSCPLPRCRYDEPAADLERARSERNLALWRSACQPGMTVARLMEQFGVSRRTVHRVLQAQRRSSGAA